MNSELQPSDRAASSLLLREGVILALSSAVAYLIAFSYESGYADCYGYPEWVIDVTPVRTIVTWATIASGLLIVTYGYFLFGLLVPVRALRAILFSRASLFVVAGAFIAFSAHHELWVHDNWWVGGAALALAGFTWLRVGLQWPAYFRGTDETKGLWDRVDMANMQFYEQHRPAPTPTASVAMRTLDAPFFGTPFAFALVLLPTIVIGRDFARGYGHYQASRQSSYFVSDDTPALVAVRRYGDFVVATRLAPAGSESLRAIEIIEWHSPSRAWRLRPLTDDSSAMLGCRE